MGKSFLEEMEEAICRPGPYEGLRILDHREENYRPANAIPSATADNPLHREAFASLLSAADRKTPLID